MSKIKLTGDTSGYVEISAPNVAANNTLELGGGTKILTNLDNVFTGVTTYSGNIDLNANLDLDDNNKILLGTGDDLEIYHNGSNSYIDDTGTGALFVRGNYLAFAGINGEQLINAEQNAAVELFHDGTKKLETTTTGATVTGTLVSDSVTSELDLSAISASISDTAVDVFVYDTRKDSDGGAWRKRTQHTSWYNETLNTATRGSRKEFPAVAVIVTETDRVTIYDGDDPDLPMWMVFLSGPDSSNERLLRYATNDASEMLNAILCVATNDTLAYISFIDEYHRLYHTGAEYYFPERTGIVDRNVIIGEPTGPESGGYGLPSSDTNDVAMTVLPNAPIDSATGLPVPTIAVATEGGVGVIKDDGTVVDLTITTGSNNDADRIDFTDDNRVVIQWGGDSAGEITIDEIPSADTSANYPINLPGSHYNDNSPGSYSPIFLTEGPSTTNRHPTAIAQFRAVGTTAALSLFDENKTSEEDGMVAYAATSYNTGWMQGRIRGAFLSDTDTTNVTASSAHYTETFTGSGDNSWNVASSATISGGVLTLANAADSRATDLTAASSLTTGQKYIAEIEIVSNTSQIFQLDDDGAGAGQGSVTSYGSCTSGQTGTFLIAFTKTGSPRMRFIRLSGGPATITSFKIYTAEEQDRSVNNNGLKVFGTITKSAVATGAELVSYSGWSSSNYLRQPYNSDLDFGTGDWSYMFWYNPNDAESGDVIFSRWSYNVDSNQAPRVSVYFNSGNLRVDTADASAGSGYQGHFGSDGTQDSNKWHCAVILRRESNLEIWIDGKNYKIAALNSNSDGSYTDSNAILEIGHSPGNGAAEAGLELALFRVSATAPSPEQIKKIYEDEKVLFQENAKATLYGSSDAVTALGYDEDTELLHVGTSAGRSDFQGLRRINNTTTAVTTAISASDDLIAEQ